MHVAIIMDGNGRWASAQGLPRLTGHHAGAKSLRSVVESAPSLGVTDLTVYAFSSDNWKRPPEEVNGLMSLFVRYLQSEAKACTRDGVRLSVIGRRDRLPDRIPAEIAKAEAATAGGGSLVLRIAVDYSARDTLLAASDLARQTGHVTRESIGAQLPAPDVDLLIRTGGEQRLSDFLLWECAYAEFIFSPILWPDFRGADLADCVKTFERRQRRFGSLPAA